MTQQGQVSDNGAAEAAAAMTAQLRRELQEAQALEAEANARIVALGTAHRSVVETLAHVAAEQGRLTALHTDAVADVERLRAELKTSERERRLLANRAARLERFESTRTYRLVRLTWRLRARLGTGRGADSA